MSAPALAHAPTSRLYINRVGLWLFLLSEGFLFWALLSSRYFVLGVSRPVELNQPLGLAITLLLLLSSLTAYRAETWAALGHRQGFQRNILATVALGALFLVGVGLEWSEAFRSFPPQTAFGSLFFTLTGVHGFHVLSGLLVLGVVSFYGRRGRFAAGNYWGVEGSVKYWHFVDVAWMFIYPTLYLVG